MSITKELIDKAKYLKAECHVRYPEDSVLNGIQDKGSNMPCLENGVWRPVIELETGKIINWEQGNTAEIAYKVCDEGNYYLLDIEKQIIAKDEDYYVVNMMSPRANGFGDYVFMDIDENGLIQSWKLNFSDFEAFKEEK